MPFLALVYSVADWPVMLWAGYLLLRTPIRCWWIRNLWEKTVHSCCVTAKAPWLQWAPQVDRNTVGPTMTCAAAMFPFHAWHYWAGHCFLEALHRFLNTYSSYMLKCRTPRVTHSPLTWLTQPCQPVAVQFPANPMSWADCMCRTPVNWLTPIATPQ